MKLVSNIILIALSSLALSSCASTTINNNKIYDNEIVINDPIEEVNRKVMAFNQVIDKIIINPIIKGYRAIIPTPARSGIRNFLRNLKSPVILANQLLQGDINGARNALLRATINTTIGVGGIFDVAGYEGIEYEPEDFGQTLAVWGIKPGPYIVLPILGPSSLRDYGGYIADSFADPVRLKLFHHDNEWLYAGKSTADYIDLRESLIDTLNELKTSSIDYYAAVRSTYYQHREALINDRKSNTQSSIPAFPYYEDYDD